MCVKASQDLSVLGLLMEQLLAVMVRKDVRNAAMRLNPVNI